MRTLLLFLLTSFVMASSAVAQMPKVRATLDKPEYWLGERMQFAIELLVPGYFDGTPVFDLPSSGALLLLPPAGHPVLNTEEIDGTTYTVQRHELSAYARRENVTEIPELKVRLKFKRNPLDQSGEPAELTTPALPIKLKAPAGVASGSTIISTRKLSVVESWTPEPARAIVGNAFTRTVTFSAPDTPGMAFPPIPASRIDGLSIYRKPPAVNDRDDRGSLTGERVETLTYVCAKPGTFTIPALRFTWFDLESRQLQHVVLPARQVEVAPVFSATQAEAAARSSRSISARTVIFVVSAIAAAMALVVAVRRWWGVIRSPFVAVRLAPLNPPDTAS